MSLVQRVTSIEGIDRPSPRLESLFDARTPHGYGTIDAGHPLSRQPSQQKHIISYDALRNPDEIAGAASAVGVTAYKVPSSRRLAQVCFTVLACWLASGIVFGFAALKPVLIDQGVYRELCTPNELRADVEICFKQDLRLNTFFALASTTSNISALPVGTILDWYGPRVASIIGSIALAVGSVLMACAFYIPAFDGYMIGNVFIALGGTFIFVPAYSIANAFPKFSGTIVATVTGAFDASAAVFLFYRLAYDASGGRFEPQQFFLVYLVVPILILITQLTLMNEDAYKTVSQLEMKIEREEDANQDVHSSDDDLSDEGVQAFRSQRRERRESKLQELNKLVGNAEERRYRAEKEEDRHEASGVWGVLHGQSAMDQMFSPWFILITCLTVLQMLRMNFFIATIRAQYEYMLGSVTLAKSVNFVFDVALPIGGVAATPFIGMLLDNFSTAGMLAILTGLITAVGLFGCLPFLWAGYVNVILFVLLRPLYYSAVSDYAAKVFGFATFGRVYGCIITLSGIVNLFQPNIDAFSHKAFNDNPLPVNIVLASFGFLFGMTLTIYVWKQGREIALEEENIADKMGRERMIPEENESEFAISFLDLRS